MSPDDLILVQGSVNSQLVEAYALDSAIDDAIYTLGESFQAGIIDCDVYLKKVRNLSRKQFFQRLMMNKCQKRIKSDASGSEMARSVSVSSDI